MRLSRLALPTALGVAVFPSVAGAQTFLDTLGLINTIINAFIPILISLAIVAFFWGLVVYIFKIGGDDAAKNGLQIMIWGIVAIFVMVSIWGIIRLIQGTFRVDNTDPIVPKSIQLR